MCKVDTVSQVQRFCSGCSGKRQKLQHNSTKKLPNLSMETLTSTHLVLLSESRQPNRTPSKSPNGFRDRGVVFGGEAGHHFYPSFLVDIFWGWDD